METFLRDPVLAQGEEFVPIIFSGKHGNSWERSLPDLSSKKRQALEVRNVHVRDSGRYPSRSTI